MEKELKHQLNRLSRLTDKLIKLEVDLEFLAEEAKEVRIKLNDCIFHIRKSHNLTKEKTVKEAYSNCCGRTDSKVEIVNGLGICGACGEWCSFEEELIKIGD